MFYQVTADWRSRPGRSRPGRVANRHFHDAAGGGYFVSADDTTDVISARPAPVADNAVPSGNGSMVEVLAMLFFATGEARYQEAGEGSVRLSERTRSTCSASPACPPRGDAALRARRW